MLHFFEFILRIMFPCQANNRFQSRWRLDILDVAGSYYGALEFWNGLDHRKMSNWCTKIYKNNVCSTFACFLIWFVLQLVYGFSVKSSFLWLYNFFAGFFSRSRSHVLLSDLFILSDQMPLVKKQLQDCCLYAHAYRLYNAIFRFGNSWNENDFARCCAKRVLNIANTDIKDSGIGQCAWMWCTCWKRGNAFIFFFKLLYVGTC